MASINPNIPISNAPSPSGPEKASKSNSKTAQVASVSLNAVSPSPSEGKISLSTNTDLNVLEKTNSAAVSTIYKKEKAFTPKMEVVKNEYKATAIDILKRGPNPDSTQNKSEPFEFESTIPGTNVKQKERVFLDSQYVKDIRRVNQFTIDGKQIWKLPSATDTSKKAQDMKQEAPLTVHLAIKNAVGHNEAIRLENIINQAITSEIVSSYIAKGQFLASKYQTMNLDTQSSEYPGKIVFTYQITFNLNPDSNEKPELIRIGLKVITSKEQLKSGNFDDLEVRETTERLTTKYNVAV